MKVKSLTGITAEVTGKDWRRAIDQILRENSLMAKAGEESKIDPEEIEKLLEEDDE
jgi:hypothetical protein